MTPEAGQLLHANPVGADCPDLVYALLSHIRRAIDRVYWNVNQKSWGFSYDADEEWYWNTPDLPENGTGIPGIAWRAYYNWGGCPDDPDWDHEKAALPNFSFEEVEIRWYKRFGRSLNANVVWPPEKWVAWFDRCLDAIRVYENRKDCYPREEAIDNGRAARHCPTCDRYYVQIGNDGRCGWDGTKLSRVELTAEDRANIKRKRDEWRAARKHGVPDAYEITESVDIARGWRAVLALSDSMMSRFFKLDGPRPKQTSALLLYPCGCVAGSMTADEATCRKTVAEYVGDLTDDTAWLIEHEKRHEAGPF